MQAVVSVYLSSGSNYSYFCSEMPIVAYLLVFFPIVWYKQCFTKDIPDEVQTIKGKRWIVGMAFFDQCADILMIYGTFSSPDLWSCFSLRVKVLHIRRVLLFLSLHRFDLVPFFQPRPDIVFFPCLVCPQSVVPLTMIASIIFFRRRYWITHYLGAAIVIGGVVCSALTLSSFRTTAYCPFGVLWLCF